MRHSPARGDGRGDLSAAARHWLLIGNSRWHWRAWPAQPQGGREPADRGAARLGALAPEQLLAWAAVGAVPQRWAAALPETKRVTTAQVPLAAAPVWLGVDRALAGWGAWRRSDGHPVLVADAGTALSLTRVNGQGQFAGGRLLAGAGLQLRALAQATAALPELARGALAEGVSGDPWPAATAPALAVGVVRGLAAALIAAAGELEVPERRPTQLWLTGGDGPLLAPLLAQEQRAWRLAPDLVLDTLAELRPGPDP